MALILRPPRLEEKILLTCKRTDGGYIVLCLYRQEFVVWFRDQDGNDHQGDYCSTLSHALNVYQRRGTIEGGI